MQNCTYIICFNFLNTIVTNLLANFPLLASCMCMCRNGSWLHLFSDNLIQSTQGKQLLRHSCMYLICPFYQTDTHRVKNVRTCTNLKIQLEKLLHGIQSQCSWLKSLSSASDVTSACSVSCSPPSFSLPLAYPLSSAEPIFWHFRRCSSHACHLSPPPLTLSSRLSIESMRLCRKLMYFVELTPWRLHHLEVGKWYWVERPIFSV